MKKLFTLLTVALVATSFSATNVIADPGPYDTSKCTDDNGAAVFTACEAGNGKDIFDAVNKVFTDRGLANPGHTSNEDTDSIQVTSQNEYWQQLSPDDASEFAFVSITAANTNRLGVFPFGGDAGSDSSFANLTFTGTQFTGAGSAGDPYPGFVNPLGGANFGFSLESTPNGFGSVQTFSSDPDQNVDGLDHMLAFQLADLAGQTIYVHIDGNNDGDLDDAEDTVEEIVLTEETFLIAWEDKRQQSSGFDSDYNDAIYLVTRIQPDVPAVPEPMSMLLFGSGLAAMAGTRKRKLS